MLTQAAAKAAGARDRAYKLADAGGLFLFVTPAGTKSWRLKYRYGGKEKLLVIGRFPTVSLVDARRRREEAKAQLREGIDPSGTRAVLETFEQLARAWYGHAAAAWSSAHADDVLASLERDVLPAIGARAAGSIEPRELLELLRQIERRGCVETARRMRQRLSAIFGFGIAEGLVGSDPAAQLGRAMIATRPSRPQPALTQIESCRVLLAACDRAGARPVTVLASRFLALTAVRLDAVRGMRWDEIVLRQAQDGREEWLWRVPAARMKLKRAKKDDARFDHLVPLSAAAMEVLHRAAQLVVDPMLIGGEPRENGYDTPSRLPEAPCFPANGLVFAGRGLVCPKNTASFGQKPIGEGAIGALYDRAGFSGQHVPHGWRASFSTIMNEMMGPDWRGDIDRALAHSAKDKVEAAYNRAALLDRRRDLFDRWGAMLAT